MIWVIPMAGKGTRTRKLGEFKPFIEINGHRMFGWFLSSVKHLINPGDKFILITTDYFAKKYNFGTEVKKIFAYHNVPNKLQIITCKDTPAGASATVFFSKK